MGWCTLVYGIDICSIVGANGFLRLENKKVKAVLIFMGKNEVWVCQPPTLSNGLLVPIIMKAYEDSKWP